MNEERDLKKAVKAGEAEAIRQAFDRLFKTYWNLVYSCVIEDTGFDDEAEDDTIYAFSYLFTNLPRIVGEGSIKRYLIVTAKTHAIKRKEKSGKLKTESYEEGLDEGSASDPLQETPEDGILSLAKKTLSPNEYKIFVWRAGEGMRLNKIAKALNISDDAAYRLYKNAIKRMKEAIEHETKEN